MTLNTFSFRKRFPNLTEFWFTGEFRNFKLRFPFRKIWVQGFLGLLLIGFCVPYAFAHSNKMKSPPLPSLYRAPEIVGLENWINSPTIRSLEDLRGKVVLVDFWTYSCINCIRTLPYIQSWHERYSEDGLVVLGIHAPEFQFERNLKNVKGAVKKYGLTYPVALDNGFKLWRAYRNRYWPALYLIDKNGIVRYSHFGEGNYKITEENIVQLLESK